MIAATYVARDGESDGVLEALTNMTSPSRDEPGNLMYRAHRSVEDANVFFIYEEYADADAFAAHCATEHFELYIKTEAWPRLAQRSVVRAALLAG